MSNWISYYQGKEEHTVAGQILVFPNFHSPQLGNTRDIFVHVPPLYAVEPERRYPVIYMQDGQNLFDKHQSFSDEWRVDETLQQLSQEGIEALVVGLPNTAERLDEYSPFVDGEHGGGRGDAYLQFIIESVKPRIDADFRTMPDRSATGILGSSMGGLISLYGLLTRPDAFGFAGVLSPAVWFADDAIRRTMEAMPQLPNVRLYMDVGTDELGADEGKSAEYLEKVRAVRDLLNAKGIGDRLLYKEAEGATHSEQEWANRLPDALRFLLSV
jgi:predicted alpha/beta superfamily hydrolase